MLLRPRRSPSILITRMSETISARLSTAVSGGDLTKTDADAMKADMTGRLDVALAQKGMRGPGGGQRPAGPPPSTGRVRREWGATHCRPRRVDGNFPPHCS